MTEKEMIQNLLKTAESEVGYIEKASNKDLDDKTANIGAANYTKYGRDMHEISPSVMDFPAAWCDCFVDWCFYKTFGESVAKELLGGSFNDYTVQSAQLYKNKGAYYKSNPKAGDQIFFRNDTRINHTGIVYDVDGSYVYTYEGNTSAGDNTIVANGGCVASKKYLLSNPRIDGYGRPDYAAFSTPEFYEMIDISHHNTIDLAAAAAQYKDVIIRIGYRGSASGILTLDQKFLSHAQAAIANGFRYSFYFTDQSVNEAEAVQQADWVAGLIEPLTISHPIFIDSEYANKNHTGRADAISKDQRTRNIIAFCERIKTHGYVPGVYASDSWFKSMVDYDRLKQYVIWCARYSENAPTIPRYDIWQYGSKIIPGSASPIDVNRVYNNIDSSPAPEIKPHYFCTVTACSLNVRNKPGTDGVIVSVLYKDEPVSVYAMKGHWCKISPDSEKWCSYSYLKPTIGAITNCSKLNCRHAPVSGAILFVLNGGDKVNVLNQDETTGWYFIEHDGKTGYISKNYISL